MPFDAKGNYISVAEWKRQMGIGQQPSPATAAPEAQAKKPGLLSRVGQAIRNIGPHVDESTVPEAFKVAMGGYKYATSPEYTETRGYKVYQALKPIEQPASAFLGGAINAASLGVLGGLDTSDTATTAGKIAGTAGELVGAMLPIGGAAGVAGKLIPASEKASRVVNILRSGARLGTTGALYGGAEAIVQGQPVVPAAAKSAAMFAAGGGLGGAVGKGIEKVAPKLAETIPGRVAAALPRGFATGAGAAATQAALASKGEQRPTLGQMATEGGKLALYEAVTAGLTGAPAVRPVKATEVPRTEEAKAAEPVVEPPKAAPVEVKKPGVKAEQVTTEEVAATRPERPITAEEAAEARPYRPYPIDKGTLWIDATNPEDVRYFYEDPTNRTGASGGIVRLPDGSLKRIEGAWSSNMSAVEQAAGLKLEEYRGPHNRVHYRVAGMEGAPASEAKAAELKAVAAKQRRKATKAKVAGPAQTPQPVAPLLDVKQGDTVLYPSTFPKDAKPYRVLGVKGDKVTLWDGKIALVTERDTISRPGASPDQAPAAEAKPPERAVSSKRGKAGRAVTPAVESGAIEAYHGSGAANIEEFFATPKEMGGSTGASTSRLGAFFSESPVIASMAAYGFNQQGALDPSRQLTLYKVKLNLKNPLDVNNLTPDTLARLEDKFPGISQVIRTAKDPFDIVRFLAKSRASEPNPAISNFAEYAAKRGLSREQAEVEVRAESPLFREWRSRLDANSAAYAYTDAPKKLKELGYDGIVVTTAVDSGENLGPQKQYIVFDKRNISIVGREPVTDYTRRLEAGEAKTTPANVVVQRVVEALRKPPMQYAVGDQVRMIGRPDVFTVVDTRDPSLLTLKSDQGAQLRVGRNVLERVGPAATAPTEEVKPPAEAVPVAKEPWEMTRRQYEASGAYPLPAADVLIKQRDELLRQQRTLEEPLIRAAGYWKHTRFPDLAVRKTELGAATEWQPRTVADALKSTKPGVKALREQYRSLGSQIEKLGQEIDRLTAHKAHVDAALAEGKPVPAAVLAEYPELTAKAAESTALSRVQAATPTEGSKEVLGSPPGVPTGIPVNPRGTISAGTIREVVATLGKLGAPIRAGRVPGGRQAAYKAGPEVIRTKLPYDIQRTAHDIGHHLDKHLALSANPDPAIQAEFANLAQLVGATEDIPMEGVGEYIRHYLVDPKKARAVAPKFAAEFDRVLADNKPVADALDAAQQRIADLKNASPEGVIRSLMSVGENTKPRPVTARDLYVHVVDDLDPIRQFEQLLTGGEKIGEADSAYIQARRSRGWQGVVNTVLHWGTFSPDLKKTGPSYKEAIKPVRTKIDKLRDYVLAKRILEIKDRVELLPGQGFYDRDTILKNAQAVVDDIGKQKDVVKAADTRQKWYRGMTQMMVDAGILSAEDRAAMHAMWESYAPLFRVFEDLAMQQKTGKGYVDLRRAIRAMKGSARPVIDPLESDIKNAYVFMNLAERNKVALKLIELAEKYPGGGALVERVTPKMKPTEFSLKEIADALKGAGADLYGVDLDKAATIFRPLMQGSAGENIVTVYRNGKVELYKLHPDLYEAMKNLNTPSFTIIDRVMSLPTKTLRAGAVTFNPAFMVARNPVRDMFTAFVYGKVTPVDFVRGLMHVFKADDVYYKFHASGAGQAAIVSFDRNYFQRDMRALYGQGRGGPLPWAQMLSEGFEEATRVGAWERDIKRYGYTPEGIAKAAMKGREITVDFGRRGIYGPKANAWIAFFNAQVQGADRMVRAFKDDPFGTTFRATLAITLPSILLYLLNRDNPEYQELSDQEKDLYWHVPLPNGGFLRAPKPFELGIMFGSFPERVMTWLDQNDRKTLDNFFEEMKPWLGNAWEGITPGVVPTLVAPFYEIAANRKVFGGKKLIPEREMELPPAEQYGPYTSEIGKLVGKALNKSPRYFDQFVKDWFGGTGTMAVDGLDTILRAGGLAEDDLKTGTGAWPIINGFYARAYSGTSDSIEHFYEVWNRAEAVYNGRRARIQRGQDISNLTGEEGSLLLGLPTLRAVGGLLSEIRAIQRTAMYSDNLTPQEREAVRTYLDFCQMNLVRLVSGKALLTLPEEMISTAETKLPQVFKDYETTEAKLKAVAEQLRQRQLGPSK